MAQEVKGKHCNIFSTQRAGIRVIHYTVKLGLRDVLSS